MIRPTRLGAAATIAALGVSMATPAIDAASAATANPISLPGTSQLTTSLSQLGYSSGQISTVVGDLQSLQGNNLTSLQLGSLLTNLDTTLSSVLSGIGGLLGSLLSPTGVLEATIGAIPGTGSSAAATQAQAELKAILTSAGLGSILSGLSSDGGASALTQLAALQSLPPGASTASGGLASVGAIISGLAAKASGADASSLSTVAGLLSSSSPLTPAQLETAISDLLTITSSTGSGTPDVSVAQAATALASQLAQSGSLLGGLAGVGSTLSALTGSSSLTSALGQLSSLGSAVPGSINPLSGVAAVLSSVAATPGVSGTPAASTLNTLASTLADPNGVSASDLINTISGLSSAASSLPAPLNTVVSGLVTQLSSSGSIFGTLPGLSPADVTAALSELGSIANLSAGQETPLLPGLASVLTAIGAQSPVAGTPVQTLLDNLASAVSTNPLTGPALAALASLLTNVASTLPAPLGTTVSGLSGLLAKGAAVSAGSSTGTGGGSTATGGTSTGTRGGSGAGGSSASHTSVPATLVVIPGVSGLMLAKAYVYHWGLLRKVTRTSHAAAVTLTCEASSGKWCTDTIKLNEKGYHALSKQVHFRAGKTDRWVYNLKAVKTSKSAARKRAAKRPVMKVRITSGAYKVSRSLK